jgi:3D (Asp-Asp-Asp) domain-containing protein
VEKLSAILGLKSDPISSGRKADATLPAPEAQGSAATDETPPMKHFTFTALFLLTACATTVVPGMTAGPAITPPPEQPLAPLERAVTFALEEPAPQTLGPNLRLWATHYHTPIVTPAPEAISAAFPLLGRDGSWLSPPLRQKDWCEAALQGSVSVKQGGKSTAYVFVDSNGPEQTNCDEFLGSLSDGVKNATRRARFMAVNHPLGCGVRNLPLMPFRTIAVDPDVIPLESVIFVPELRGRKFQLNDREFIHDGYLFAGDRGGAIRGRHIDVFMIDDQFEPLEDLFASTDKRTFAAHVVDAEHPMAAAVKASQSSSCEPVLPQG